MIVSPSYVDQVKRIFSTIVFVQFCVSGFCITTSILQCTLQKTNFSDTLVAIQYLLAMLVQFFLYCWLGNEVTLQVWFNTLLKLRKISVQLLVQIFQSSDFGDRLYETDWTGLNTSTIHDIMFMMVRCSKPILVNCGPLIILNLESFTKVTISLFQGLFEIPSES